MTAAEAVETSVTNSLSQDYTNLDDLSLARSNNGNKIDNARDDDNYSNKRFNNDSDHDKDITLIKITTFQVFPLILTTCYGRSSSFFPSNFFKNMSKKLKEKLKTVVIFIRIACYLSPTRYTCKVKG